MNFQDLAGHSRFWKAVNYLENLNRNIEKQTVSSDLLICERDLYSILTLLSSVGLKFQINNNSNVEYLSRDQEIDINSDSLFPMLSSSEKLQMIVFYVSQVDSDVSKNFKESFDQILGSSEFRAIANFLEKVSDDFSNKNSNVISFKKNDEPILKVERAMFHKNVLTILSKDQQELSVLPFKIMKLDGELTLIAEEVESAECIHLPFSQISFVKEFDECYQPIISKLEFEDYINSLRTIKETQVRLILKVDNNVEWEDSVAYQHFGNPCLIKKGKSHLIWAASVEPSEEVFEWISNMGPGVEIIDPSAFKRVYLRYCENKLLRVG